MTCEAQAAAGVVRSVVVATAIGFAAIPSNQAVAGMPEAFFVVAGAWACQAPGAIEDVERLDALERGNGRPRYSAEFDRLAKQGECGVPFAERYAIKVMHADDKFAFFCDVYGWTDSHDARSRVGLSCRYALISDVRDSQGHKVNPEQLASASTKTTMWDVARSLPQGRSSAEH
jgi:hypothetical protein